MENNIGYITESFFKIAPQLSDTVSGKKLIKEFTTKIKNDKDLLNEYTVFNYINTLEGENVKDNINEALSYLDGIDRKKLLKLNEELAKILENNKIEIIYNDNKLIENIHKLIFTNKDLNTISNRVNIINEIANTISDNSKNNKKELTETVVKSVNSLSDLNNVLSVYVKNFDEKFNSKLTEEEKKIFKSIVNKENNQNELFEETRKECLNVTNLLLTEANNEADLKERLLNVKEKLLEQTFNINTFKEDIISLLNLKNSLKENIEE